MGNSHAYFTPVLCARLVKVYDQVRGLKECFIMLVDVHREI